MSEILMVGVTEYGSVQEFHAAEQCGCEQRVWVIRPHDAALVRLRLRFAVNPSCGLEHKLWKLRLSASDQLGDPDLNVPQSAYLGKGEITRHDVIGQTEHTVVTQRLITEKCGCMKVGWRFEPKEQQFIVAVYRRLSLGKHCPAQHELGFRKPRFFPQGRNAITDICEQGGVSVEEAIEVYRKSPEYQESAELYDEAVRQGVIHPRPTDGSPTWDEIVAEEEKRGGRGNW